MNIFGDGPQALLSLNNLPTTTVSIGESIGAFKLVDLNTVDITFDYQGTILRRTLLQLTHRMITASSGSGSGGGGNDGRSVSTPPPVPAAAPLIPKGAVETEPGTFRYTDTDGKKWIYRKTPFGVARLEDKPEEAAVAKQEAT